MELPREFPPGNYTNKFIQQMLGEPDGYRATFLQDSRPTVIGFLDVHNFTPTCNRATQENRKNSLINFLEDFYKHIIRELSNQGGEVNKLLGDGILASFPKAISACRGCINAMAWWRLNKPNFDPPFCETPSLIAIIGILDVHEFRHGHRSHYLDNSWIGAELNTFFKHSKDNQFSEHSAECVWFNERAAVELLSENIKLLRPDGETRTAAAGIAEIQIGHAKYFGLTEAEWRRQTGMPGVS
jgi:hypothetical protein